MSNSDNKIGEQILIAQLARGDEQAFRTIIDNYQASVIRVCRGFVKSHEDAEDIAQDVFIQLFRSASKIRGEAKLSTWLYRVAVNKSLNYIRSNRIRTSVATAEAESLNSFRSDESADKKVTDEQHRDALHSAIGKLPVNQRKAFVLQKYEELSYEEIASVMKVSLSSVQSLIFRAKENLQDKLRDYFENNLL